MTRRLAQRTVHEIERRLHLAAAVGVRIREHHVRDREEHAARARHGEHALEHVDPGLVVAGGDRRVPEIEP